MTELEEQSQGTQWSSASMRRRLLKRHARDRRFRWFGLTAIGVALFALALILGSIAQRGWGSFLQTQVRLEITFPTPAVMEGAEEDGQTGEAQPFAVEYGGLLRDALRSRFPEATSRSQVRALQGMVSKGARSILRDRLERDPSLLGKTVSMWLPVDDRVDRFMKLGGFGVADPAVAGLDAREANWIRELEVEGRLRQSFNWTFLSSGDSREAENAGILGALVGSLLTLFVTFCVSFPIGIGAAVYLEEIASENTFTRMVEANVNNLAAVPSIVYGLVGLAVFLGVCRLPRSAPLVGGLTLALMTLPTLIIAARAALQAVPPSLREAAIGIGASPMQVIAHHVLPAAMPGVLTGTILGVARALGETAPLLMVGMVAFVADIPHSFTDAATVLPVQIYLWADNPERAFVEKTAGAILILLAVLLSMNAFAIWFRNRFEVRW